MNAYGIDYELENRIISTNKQVHRQVQDLNCDGLVNCIDYTCLWKILWDRKYPEEKSRSIIVRIRNDKIHHLCIGVYDDYSKLILVETQIDNKNYLVNYYFGSRFNKDDIIYGETNTWLNKVKKRKL